jgi:hypothetical protein
LIGSARLETNKRAGCVELTDAGTVTADAIVCAGSGTTDGISNEKEVIHEGD